MNAQITPVIQLTQLQVFERIIHLSKMAHAQAAKQSGKGATDLCKAFLSQIADKLKQKDSTDLAINLFNANCSPNGLVLNQLIIKSNSLLFDAIVLANLFNSFAGSFEMMGAKIRFNKNFLLDIDIKLAIFLLEIQAAEFNSFVIIDDDKLIQAFCSSEITKFAIPCNAPKSLNFHVCSLKSNDSKESVNFAYDKRKNEILGVKELGYKEPNYFLI